MAGVDGNLLVDGEGTGTRQRWYRCTQEIRESSAIICFYRPLIHNKRVELRDIVDYISLRRDIRASKEWCDNLGINYQICLWFFACSGHPNQSERSFNGDVKREGTKGHQS
jgi:hypothetical protein